LKEGRTEVVAILDKSGSMVSLTRDTIGGFNSFLEEQKKQPGEMFISLVLFNDKVQTLYDHVDIKKVKKLTDKRETGYFTDGSTALFDALGTTINAVGKRLSDTPEDERPSKVLLFIVTDGEENASKEFTCDQIKQMVETQKRDYSWDFMFTGANIDSFDVGNKIGIRGINYDASHVGTEQLYASFSSTITSYRHGKDIDYNEFEKSVSV
jgi:uncharacterized protein YegL